MKTHTFLLILVCLSCVTSVYTKKGNNKSSKGRKSNSKGVSNKGKSNSNKTTGKRVGSKTRKNKIKINLKTPSFNVNYTRDCYKRGCTTNEYTRWFNKRLSCNQKANKKEKGLFLRKGRTTKKGNWNCKKLRKCYRLQTKLAKAILLTTKSSTNRISNLRNKIARKCKGIERSNSEHRKFFDYEGCFGKLQQQHVQLRNLLLNKNKLFDTQAEYRTAYRSKWDQIQNSINGVCSQQINAVEDDNCKADLNTVLGDLNKDKVDFRIASGSSSECHKAFKNFRNALGRPRWGRIFASCNDECQIDEEISNSDDGDSDEEIDSDSNDGDNQECTGDNCEDPEDPKCNEACDCVAGGIMECCPLPSCQEVNCDCPECNTDGTCTSDYEMSDDCGCPEREVANFDGVCLANVTCPVPPPVCDGVEVCHIDGICRNLDGNCEAIPEGTTVADECKLSEFAYDPNCKPLSECCDQCKTDSIYGPNGDLARCQSEEDCVCC